MASDSNDDPVLVKYAGIGALAEAREQIDSLDRDTRAFLRYELIDKWVSMAMDDRCTRQQAIGFAMKRFGVCDRTVENAIAYMDERGRAPYVCDADWETALKRAKKPPEDF